MSLRHAREKTRSKRAPKRKGTLMRAREVIGAGAVLAIVAFNGVRAADVRIQAGDVKDSRTTGQFFANLEVELKLLGDDIEGAKGLRCKVTKAVDDTGRNLLKDDKADSDFRDMDGDKPNQAQVTLQFKNPSRKAATVKELSGEIELFKPDADPTSSITVTNLTGRPKITLSNPTLTSAQIEMTVLSKEQYEKDAKAAEAKTQPKAGLEQLGEEMGKAFAGMFGGMMGGQNSILIRIKDPQSKLIKVEFLDASGKAIHREGSMTMNEMHSYDFSEPLPQAACLRVYVATSKSLIKIPFVLRDVYLP